MCENNSEPKECDMCGKKEPDVLFSHVTDVCDGCYEITDDPEE